MQKLTVITPSVFSPLAKVVSGQSLTRVISDTEKHLDSGSTVAML